MVIIKVKIKNPPGSLLLLPERWSKEHSANAYELSLTNFRNNYQPRINYVLFNEEYINFIWGLFMPKAREKFQHQIKLRFNCIKKTGRSFPELAARYSVSTRRRQRFLSRRPKDINRGCVENTFFRGTSQQISANTQSVLSNFKRKGGARCAS